MQARTKIICTIGPSVSSYEKILALIDAGMSVARLNFSHGTHEEHFQTIERLKKARKERKIPLSIMLDTHGPKIRIGEFPGGSISLSAGQKVALVKEGKASKDQIPVHPPAVIEVLSEGARILFDDGYISAKVIEKRKDALTVEILNAGVLKSGKGINVPGVEVPLPALTEGDIADIRFGCKHDVDYIAASFIRSALNILTIRELLSQEKKEIIRIIAKIENAQGVENFDSIVQAADGIMIARGDLGVELDLERVPGLQKEMIRKCYQACKPVATATQMLESMITNPRPTRAEVSDVANAIYDCTSLVMLSGETAVGKYPIETVETMRSIAIETEKSFDYPAFFQMNFEKDYHDVSSAVSLAAVKTAYSVANAKCIFAYTTSGQTARIVSRLRPPIPIIALTPSKKIYHQLAFQWGVIPVLAEGCGNSKEAFCKASQYALERRLIRFGDVVVVTAGAPFGKKGTTNMMMVENIGEILVRGHKGIGPKVDGTVVFVLAPDKFSSKDLEGKIAIITHCDQSFLPILKKAKGVVLQNSISDSKSETLAELWGKTYEISVMTRADRATSILKEGSEVTLDPQKGLIYLGSEKSPKCSDMEDS